MKVATLCPSRSLEHFAAAALRDAGYEPTPHTHLSALIAALRTPGADAVLLEDHDAHIDGWLAALRLHAGRSVPIVVLGLGDSVGISRALQRGADDYAVSVLEGLEGDVSKTLQSIQKGIALLDGRRAELLGEAPDDGLAPSGDWGDQTEGASATARS